VARTHEEPTSSSAPARFVPPGPTGLGTAAAKLARVAAGWGAVSAAELAIGTAQRSDTVRRPQILPDGSIVIEVHDYQTRESFQVSTQCPLYSGRHPRSRELQRGHREWARGHDLFADADEYEPFVRPASMCSCQRSVTGSLWRPRLSSAIS
jgi:hypothetical protein